MLSVAVMGSTGLLGRYMCDYISRYYECIPVDRSIVEATDPDMDAMETIAMMSDVVVNCIGVLKPDIIKVGAPDTIRINSVFPHILSNVCNKYNTRMIHISSDCVYTGRKGKYVEIDPPDADDLYGQSKAIHPTDCLTIRASFIGEELKTSKGFLSWLLNSKNEIDGYTNCIWNGVTCLQLCKSIKNIIDSNRYQHRLQHLFSKQHVSKYQLCVKVNEIYNTNLKINRVEADTISGSSIVNKLDRTLATIHDEFIIPNITEQITEQKNYAFSN